METILLVVGIICLVVGLAGAILPLPGPPLSFVGLLAVYYSRIVHLSSDILITFGVITAIVTVLDYYVPIWGTKKLGGTKWGMFGAGAGLLVGIFLGPLGLFIGAFSGAFFLEYFHDKDTHRSFKAATGSFLGLMAGIFMKLVLCIAMIVYVSIAFF